MKNILSTALVLCAIVVPSAHAVDRSVSVTGKCSREVTPDRGEIIVTADTLDKNLDTAIRQSTQIYESVRSGVNRLNLADANLGTSEYSVQEARDWEKGKSVFRGYRARIGLRVTSSDIKKLGDVIAIAAKESARDVSSLRMFLSDEKTKAEKFNCLQIAAQDAKAKADRLASSLQASVGEVITLSEISEESGGGPRPHYEAAMKSASAPVDAPQIEAGRQTMSVTVSAVFQIK